MRNLVNNVSVNSNGFTYLYLASYYELFNMANVRFCCEFNGVMQSNPMGA